MIDRGPYYSHNSFPMGERRATALGLSVVMAIVMIAAAGWMIFEAGLMERAPRYLATNVDLQSVMVVDPSGVGRSLVPPGSAVVMIGSTECDECRGNLTRLSVVAEGAALPRFHFIALDDMEEGAALLGRLDLLGARVASPPDVGEFLRVTGVKRVPLTLWFDVDQNLVHVVQGLIPLPEAELIVEETRLWSALELRRRPDDRGHLTGSERSE